MKRSSFTADSLKQKSNSEKDSDNQNLQIERLKNRISSLEKANFRLQIDNRDTAKDNKNLKRRNVNTHINSNSMNFIPKYKINYSGKENIRTNSNIPSDYSVTRKNIIIKYNQRNDDGDSDFNINSKEGSVILNASDFDDKQE